MRPEPVEAPLLLADTASEIRWEAKGQVLVLSPWNYPVFLVLGPLVGAVAAGNVVIVKPSEKVPETNRALRAVLAEAFPENEVAMIEGEAPVAEALLELPFDHVFFTGSTRVGKIVMAAAAKNLASVTLELGGKSPAIIAPDAHLQRAAHAIAWGKFVNAGQTCVAPDYVLVQEGQRQAFLDGLRGVVERSYGPESGWATNPEIARLVDPGAFARVKGLLDDAVQRGAKVVVGGDDQPGPALPRAHRAGGRTAGRAGAPGGDLRPGAPGGHLPHARGCAGVRPEPSQAARALRVLAIGQHGGGDPRRDQLGRGPASTTRCSTSRTRGCPSAASARAGWATTTGAPGSGPSATSGR